MATVPVTSGALDRLLTVAVPALKVTPAGRVSMNSSIVPELPPELEAMTVYVTVPPVGSPPPSRGNSDTLADLAKDNELLADTGGNAPTPILETLVCFTCVPEAMYCTGNTLAAVELGPTARKVYLAVYGRSDPEAPARNKRSTYVWAGREPSGEITISVRSRRQADAGKSLKAVGA